MKKGVLYIGVIALYAVYVVYHNMAGLSVPTVLPPRIATAPTATVPPSPSTNSRTALQEILLRLSQNIARSTPEQPISPPSTPNPIAINPAPVTTTPPVSNPMMGGGTPMMGQGQYRDGQYTGDSTYAYYGNVQVKAIIQSGKIADVQFLDYPQDRSNSRMINSYAMPLLTQEAIQVQNANVDAVSGATFTSQAFVQSLGAALVQAKN